MTTLLTFDELFPILAERNKEAHLIWGSLHVVAALLGVIGCAIVLSAMLRHKCDNVMLFFLSLLWADLIYCAVSALFGIYRFLTGRYLIGVTGCAIEGTLVVFGCSLSMSSLSAIALERYWMGVKGQFVTGLQAWKMMAVVVGLSAFLSLMPLFTGGITHLFGLFPSTVHCGIASWDKDLMGYIQFSMALAYIAVNSQILSYCYLQIYFVFRSKIRETSRGKRELQSSSHGRPGPATQLKRAIDEETEQARERQLFLKCFSITAIFVLFWFPYILRVIYEMATPNIIDGHLDGFLCVITLFNSTLNPFLLYFFDAFTKRAVNDMLGLKSWNQSLQSKSADASDVYQTHPSKPMSDSQQRSVSISHP
ncbi:hypothetical protein EDD86DRAFT_267700 [Gorgonomyces haynaldii]|nr:hypothetical protein EDD86DRAFT_267700 [Gorgonomyces haynaldii]